MGDYIFAVALVTGVTLAEVGLEVAEKCAGLVARKSEGRVRQLALSIKEEAGGTARALEMALEGRN